MKLKKKLMIILAAGIMAFSVMPLAYAEPETNDNVNTETQQTQMDNSIAANAQAAAAAETAAQQTDATELVNKKYLTKGGAVFWFIFIFVLNGAFSFWVGNRFYRLARKDNHVTAEIRALRRDIEDKMVKSVDGFTEQEFDIENLNKSLASDDEGIKPVPKQTIIRELSPEEEERFKKWEAAQSKPRIERTRTRSAVREELEEELDDVKRINRKNYQPKREIEEIAPEEDNDDLGGTRVIKQPVGDGVKNKAKEILGDIFPFKDE